MVSSTTFATLLSGLVVPVFCQVNPAASSLPDDVLPAANLTSDPIEREITTVEIPVEALPYLANTSVSGETANISYFAINGLKGPLAVVCGDVILSTVPELLNQASNSNGNSSDSKRAVSFVSQTGGTWPDGIVKYKWRSESAKDSGRLEAWTEATKRWTDLLPWLQFEEYPASEELEQYILTLVDTTGQYACFSPMGARWYGEMMLDDACGGAGTYTHELGHSKYTHARIDAPI